MCEAPPHRKNKIVDLAGRSGVAASVLATVGLGFPNRNPANPAPQATRNVRREFAMTAFRLFHKSKTADSSII
jgi:hypothetical protein